MATQATIAPLLNRFLEELGLRVALMVDEYVGAGMSENTVMPSFASRGRMAAGGRMMSLAFRCWMSAISLLPTTRAQRRQGSVSGRPKILGQYAARLGNVYWTQENGRVIGQNQGWKLPQKCPSTERQLKNT